MENFGGWDAGSQAGPAADSPAMTRKRGFLRGSHGEQLEVTRGWLSGAWAGFELAPRRPALAPAPAGRFPLCGWGLPRSRPDSPGGWGLRNILCLTAVEPAARRVGRSAS
jgi:hypothetical protein